MKREDIRTTIGTLAGESANLEQVNTFTGELESMFDERESFRTRNEALEQQVTERDNRIKELQKQNFDLYMSGFNKISDEPKGDPKNDPEPEKEIFDDVLRDLRTK